MSLRLDSNLILCTEWNINWVGTKDRHCVNLDKHFIQKQLAKVRLIT